MLKGCDRKLIYVSEEEKLITLLERYANTESELQDPIDVISNTIKRWRSDIVPDNIDLMDVGVSFGSDIEFFDGCSEGEGETVVSLSYSREQNDKEWHESMEYELKLCKIRVKNLKKSVVEYNLKCDNVKDCIAQFDDPAFMLWHGSKTRDDYLAKLRLLNEQVEEKEQRLLDTYKEIKNINTMLTI